MCQLSGNCTRRFPVLSSVCLVTGLSSTVVTDQAERSNSLAALFERPPAAQDSRFRLGKDIDTSITVRTRRLCYKTSCMTLCQLIKPQCHRHWGFINFASANLLSFCWLLKWKGQVSNSLTLIRTSSPNSTVFSPWVENMSPSLSVAESKTVCFLKISKAYFCSGKPICRRNASDSFFVFAVVTKVTASENTSFESSSPHSGKIECSLMPRV